ncbi:PAS domain S-box protein [Bacillus tianshenii]|uniref:PAS domain-containing sensor histidine kinase n=1 Tax=Sutcliffiella tianshenii TaxID=1463404 RepID=UPI001CD30623|nr:PAS domain S-box protein [Bacillus tianshenii]MCA1318958.1 PAS domain S-box protein [Bacillus tianshenii]
MKEKTESRRLKTDGWNGPEEGQAGFQAERDRELADIKYALDESSIVALTDKNGVINYVNDKFCEISGYKREEVMGKTHRIINSYHHPKDFFHNLWETIRQGNVWKGEIKNRKKDGSYYWVDTTIVPFLDKNGTPYQYLSIRSEITERKLVQEELQAMMTKLIHVQEEERKKVSRELHDGIGQNLYSLLITINRLHTELEHPLIHLLQKDVTNMIEDIRGISWDLRPSLLDDLGLIPALRSFINRYSQHYGIKVDFQTEVTGRYDVQIETAVYRIIQEALTNVRKYAEVNDVSVSIHGDEDRIKLEVLDKGVGYDPLKERLGVGLFSMEERAKSVHGKLHIDTGPGKGTLVKATIPIPLESNNIE